MLDAIVNALIGNVVVDTEIAVKLNATPATKDMSLLGSDGRSYTLSYRNKFRNGTFSAWKPVKFGN